MNQSYIIALWGFGYHGTDNIRVNSYCKFYCRGDTLIGCLRNATSLCTRGAPCKTLYLRTNHYVERS